MNFSVNIFLFIFALGAAQGIILSLLILLKRKQKAYNRYFGFLLLLLSLASAKIILQEVALSWLAEIAFPILYKFAFGPLLYLFVRDALFRNASDWQKIIPHFIPALLFDVLYFYAVPLMGYQEGDQVIQLFNFYVLNGGTIVFNLIYWLISIRVFFNFKKQRNGKAKLAKTRISRAVLSILTVDAVGSIFTIVFFILTVSNQNFRLGWGFTYYIVYVFITFYIYFLSFITYSLKEVKLLSLKSENNKKSFAEGEQWKVNHIKSEILKEHYFQDPELNLNKLSEKLDFSARELSTLINLVEGKNFNDFINELRIDYFIKLLPEEQFSIEGLAYEAGFKSKASFYRAFKKSKGKTPSQFKKEMSLKS